MNVLIIGLGSIGKKHVDALLHLDSLVKIFAFRSKLDSTQYKSVINVYTIEEIINDIDFIIVSNITSLHRETILNFIKYKKPLFIEKPVLNSTKDFQIISDEIIKNDIVTYIACNLRFHPAIEFLHKSFLKQNLIINEVNVYCGSYLPDWRPSQDYKRSYSAFSEYGGGVDLDLIHEIDYCIWLFSFPKFVKSVKRSTSSLNINSVDCARYFFEYEKFSLAITLNYYRKDAKRQIEILTNDDTFLFDLIDNYVLRYSDNKKIVTFDVCNTYVKQLEYFVGCIKQKLKPMNDFNEAIKILNITLNE